MKTFSVSVEELKWILSRALNCLEPQLMPDWAMSLADTLERGEDVRILTCQNLVNQLVDIPKDGNHGYWTELVIRDYLEHGHY